ncbi:MAG: hypothetical protein ABIN96_04545 [Rubrivivax sp.]
MTATSTPHRDLPLVSAMAALLALPLPGTAAGPSPSDLRAAQCVAALEVNTQDLAHQVKAGDETMRPLLLERLISGTAFVGDVYLSGNVGEKQARALADQALEDQKHLSAQELQDRQRVCAKEGNTLYTTSNAFQRAFVRHVAQRRMRKLLGS